VLSAEACLFVISVASYVTICRRIEKQYGTACRFIVTDGRVDIQADAMPHTIGSVCVLYICKCGTVSCISILTEKILSVTVTDSNLRLNIAPVCSKSLYFIACALGHKHSEGD
jgi:hypothetical protein